MKTYPSFQSAISSLTDSTGGTADNTLVDVGLVFTQANINNDLADLTAKVNDILAKLRLAGIIA